MNICELLFEFLKSKYSFVSYLKNLLDSLTISYYVESSDGKLLDDFKIECALSKFSRNLIERQVTDLNSAVEYHNFIFGCLEFQGVENSLLMLLVRPKHTIQDYVHNSRFLLGIDRFLRDRIVTGG